MTGDVASVLAALMAGRGTRASELSYEVECDASHISNILHRKCRPSPDLAARLDAALGDGGHVSAALARTPVPARRGGRA